VSPIVAARVGNFIYWIGPVVVAMAMLGSSSATFDDALRATRAIMRGLFTTTVDVTFSLECRSLESQPNKTITLPWSTAVTDYENDPRNRKSLEIGGDGAHNGNVAHYDSGVRLAFNHGEPDGNSHYAAGSLRVVQATQERIDLRGADGFTGWAEDGCIDCRTGHAEINHYAVRGKKWGFNSPLYDDIYNWFMNGKLSPIYDPIFKQFIFECKPSKPTLF
jgi:hypothetical protein